MTVHRIAGCILGTIVLAGCGSSQKVSTVTVTEHAGSAGVSSATTGVNAPASSGQQPLSTTEDGNKLMAEVKLGQPVTVEGVKFQALSAKTVASIPVPYDSPVRPVAGARLVLVKVKATNMGSTAIAPFCGDSGAVLGDPSHRNWEINGDQTLSIEGSNATSICDDLQPGLPAKISLVFDVPKTANITYIALWNSDADPQGQEYVDVDLP
jgi:hypothetical protein